ncbi:MAG: hypothetical protein JSU81_10565 [Candidatus Coatesbacteria bacterium]|nr:MAG: hypothetical protein JSU81_10565 [Candidatus Coatesbacteria bacterium]
MRPVIAILVLGMLAGGASARDSVELVYISEVLYDAGSNSPPPFIELYYAGKKGDNLDISGWRIRIKVKDTVETVTLPASAKIPGCGFYLIGREADRGTWSSSRFPYKPDFYCTASMDYKPGEGGVQLIRSGGGADAVGWGRVIIPFYEEVPHLGVREGHSLERKSGEAHNETKGNSYDTDNNLNDFRDRSSPQPQNIHSPLEYPAASTENDAWGRIKAMYYG